MRHCLSLYEFFLFHADKVKILLLKYGSVSVIEEILNYISDLERQNGG